MIFKFKRRRINLSYEDSKRQFNNLLAYFFVLFLSHAIIFWIVEPVSFFNAIWVSVISITTIGYGDISATTTIGKVTTMLLVGVGVFVLANLATAFIYLRSDIKDAKRSGKWLWNLKDHIVIANFPSNYTVNDMIGLVKAVRNNPKFKDKAIQILTDRFDGHPLPDDLLNITDVVLYNGIPSNSKALEAVNIKDAFDVIILNLHDDNDPDGYTFDVIRRLRDIRPLGSGLNIVAQCQKDIERKRLLKAGANSCIRPVRAYPEIIALVMEHNSIMVDFFEDIMSKDGDELLVVDISKTSQFHPKLLWKDVIEKLADSNRGLALGYIDENGVIEYNPDLHSFAKIYKIILLEYEDSSSTPIEEIFFNQVES